MGAHIHHLGLHRAVPTTLLAHTYAEGRQEVGQGGTGGDFSGSDCLEACEKEEATGTVSGGDTFCPGTLVNTGEWDAYVCECVYLCYRGRERKRENRQKD